MYQEANQILQAYGTIIKPHTVLLSFGEAGAPCGTAVLVEYKRKKLMLTATHVARKLKSHKLVRVITEIDNILRFPPTWKSDGLSVKEWDTNFEESVYKKDFMSLKSKDLAVIEMNPAILSSLLQNSNKMFYRIPEENNLQQYLNPSSSLVSLGILGAQNKNNLFSGNFTTLGVIASPSIIDEDLDYAICHLSTDTFETRSLGKELITDFRGLSGGGLWIIKNDKPLLLGIAIAQDLDNFRKQQDGLLYFHGPNSIFSVLRAWENEPNTEIEYSSRLR